MKHTNLTKGHLLSNKMNVDLDVFGTAVLNRVGGHVHCADIITKNDHGSRQGVMKLCKKLTNPAALCNSVSHITILRLSTRSGNRGLSLGGSRHQGVTEIDTVI